MSLKILNDLITKIGGSFQKVGFLDWAWSQAWYNREVLLDGVGWTFQGEVTRRTALHHNTQPHTL